MSYINSNAINVFPCANRGSDYNLQSRLTSEYNLTNIINQLIDQDSFVITSVLTTDGPLAFNIHGYYFNVSNYTSITGLGLGNDIYAYIRVFSSTSNGVVFQELGTSGTEEGTELDSNSTFMGVNFVATQEEVPTSGDNNFYYSLHILHSDNGTNWTIPEESTVKFITNSTRRSIRIDDGEL